MELTNTNITEPSNTGETGLGEWGRGQKEPAKAKAGFCPFGYGRGGVGILPVDQNSRIGGIFGGKVQNILHVLQVSDSTLSSDYENMWTTKSGAVRTELTDSALVMLICFPKIMIKQYFYIFFLLYL